MKNTLIRTIHPEIRIVDAKRGIVDYVASDETLDCYREVIKAEGWKFTHFRKNAPFVDSHDYSCIDKLLGKVTDFRVEKKQLIEQVQWAIDVPEAALAQLGWKMTEAGYLKAVSVGFFTSKCAHKYGDEASFLEAVKELGLTPETAATVRCIYLEQEQIELSACIIGANPNALAKAHKDGAVRDADLDAVGMDDSGMEALHRAAALYEDADPTRRFLLDMAVRALRTGTKNFPKETTQPRDSADAPAGAEPATRRERAAFLGDLHRLVGG